MTGRLLLFLFITLPLFAAEHGGAHPEEPSIWWKWANFAILAAVLGYLIKKHAGPFFRARTDEIQFGLKEAAAMRESAESKVADIEKRVANLETEVASLKTSARQEMDVEAARIKAETAKTLERMQYQAQFEIASATKLAAADLKQRAARLAVELAASEIRQRMSGAAHEKLVSGFVSQLAQPARK